LPEGRGDTGTRYPDQPAGLLAGDDQRRFLAGAHVDSGDSKILLFSMLRLFRFLSATQKQEFLQQVTEAA